MREGLRVGDWRMDEWKADDGWEEQAPQMWPEPADGWGQEDRGNWEVDVGPGDRWGWEPEIESGDSSVERG